MNPAVPQYRCARCGLAGPTLDAAARAGAPCPSCGGVAVPLEPGAAEAVASASQLLGPGGSTTVGAAGASGSVALPVRPPPARIGRYDVHAELGRGGMGVVYKGFDPALHRWVALKMIRHAGGETIDVDRFVREARLAARLRHPGIVSVHDAGRHEDQLYIAMDLVEGESLETVFKRERLDPRRVAELARDIALALDHAHGQGVIHRDVKPPNVIIGADGRPRLTDFGLARETTTGAYHLTLTGEVVGTPAYMAPEQCTGKEREPRVSFDIWAMGVLLYRGLADRTPFEGENALAVMQAVLAADPDPLRRVAPDVPVDLETITSRCLEKDPARRYPTARALADDLERFLAGKRIAARPVGPRSRVMRWVGRHRGGASLVAVGLAVAVTAVCVGLFTAQRARREIARARREAGEARDAAERARARARRAEERAAREAVAVRSREDPAPGEPGAASRAAASDERARAAALFERGDRYLSEKRHQLAWAAFARVLQTRDDPIVRMRLARARSASPILAWSTSFREPAAVGAMAWSPDGRTIAGPGGDGVVVWDLRDGRIARSIACDEGRPTAIAFSPDGTRIAVASPMRGAVVLFDAASGEARGAIGELGEAVRELAFIEGERVLAVGARGAMATFGLDGQASDDRVSLPGGVKSVAVADGGGAVALGTDAAIALYRTGPLASLPPSLEADGGAITAVAFAPGGRQLVSGDAHGKMIVWDVESGQPLARLPEHAARVEAIAWSPDQRLIASYAADRTLVIFDAAAGQPLGSPIRAADDVHRLAFDPGSRHLAAMDRRGSLRVWALEAPRRLAAGLFGHSGRVGRLAASPDGRLLASVGDDGTYRLWDAASGGMTHIAVQRPAGGLAVRWRPDGTGVVVVHRSGEVVLWSPAAGNLTQLRPAAGGGRGRRVAAAALSADARWCALAQERSVELHDLQAAPGAGPFRGFDQTDDVTAVALDATGAGLVVGLRSGAVRVFETGTGHAVAALPEHVGPIGWIAWGGGTVAVADAAHYVRLWSLRSGNIEPADRLQATLMEPEQPAVGLEVDPSGRFVLAADQGGAVRMWMSDGTPMGTWTASRWPLTGMTFAGSAGIFTANDRGEIRRWSLPQRPESWVLTRHEQELSALAWSPDGRLLASADAGGGIVLREAQTTRVVATLGARGAGTPAVRAVAFAPDGARLAAGDETGAITLWDIATGAAAGRIEAAEDAGASVAVTGLVWSADGSRLYGAESPGGRPLGGRLRVHELDGAQVRSRLIREGAQSGRAGIAPGGRLAAWGLLMGEVVTLRLDEPGAVEQVIATGPPGVWCAAAVSADGRRLVVGGGANRRGQLHGALRAFIDGEEHLVIGRPGSLVDHVAMSPDGELVAAADKTRHEVTIYRTTTGEEVCVRRQPTPVTGLAFHPTGAVLAIGVSGGQVILWDLRAIAEPAADLAAEAERSTALRFEGDGLEPVPFDSNRLTLQGR